MKKFLTSEEAIELLPEGKEIHTFYNFPFGLVGGDWEREDIIEKLKGENNKIEVCGESARAMGHGICVYSKGETIQSNILFIETNMDKLNEIDPLPEKKEEQATVSEKSIVHCKDCKYYHVAWDGTQEYDSDQYWCEYVDPDPWDFCSLAVSRQQEDKHEANY